MNFNVNTSIITNNGYINFEGFDQSNEDIKLQTYGLISRIFRRCLGTEFVSVTGTNNKVFYTTKAKMDAWHEAQTAKISVMEGRLNINITVENVIQYYRDENTKDKTLEDHDLVSKKLGLLNNELVKAESHLKTKTEEHYESLETREENILQAQKGLEQITKKEFDLDTQYKNNLTPSQYSSWFDYDDTKKNAMTNRYNEYKAIYKTTKESMQQKLNELLEESKLQEEAFSQYKTHMEMIINATTESIKPLEILKTALEIFIQSRIDNQKTYFTVVAEGPENEE